MNEIYTAATLIFAGIWIIGCGIGGILFAIRGQLKRIADQLERDDEVRS